MGKPTGFLEIPREENPFRAWDERIGDFDDLHTPLSDAARKDQAARCMNCGVPYCQSGYGCPLHNLIPEWNDLIYRGAIREAFERLIKTAPFPEFTGYVCPALCEKACMLAPADGGVANRDTELYLIETAYRNGWMKPRLPLRRTGKRVAIVGAGPSGLAAADRLNRLGHFVDVYDRADRPGGLLTYGIPNMKLPKEIVARRIRLMEEEGVHFHMNASVSPETLTDYDAALLCCGARRPRALNVEGESAKNVLFAVDYLTEATRALLEKRESRLSAEGKRVVIIGGGDTGNDCAGTAIRQKCASIVQLELMSAPPVDRLPGNPWPEWPRTLRTDYGLTEAIARQGADPRLYCTTVRRVVPDESGAVRALEIVSVRWGARGFELLPDTARVIPCDMALIAAGFLGCENVTAETFHLTLTKRGAVETDGTHRVSGRLFAAGDMRTGQSLVVRAMADALAAADEIHAFLS